MKFLAVLFTLALLPHPEAFAAVPPSDEALEASAAALEAQSVKTLGLGIRSLALLLAADPNSFTPKWYLERSGKWAMIEELKAAGLIEVNLRETLPGGTSTGETQVNYTLTPKGRAVASGLGQKAPN